MCFSKLVEGFIYGFEAIVECGCLVSHQVVFGQEFIHGEVVVLHRTEGDAQGELDDVAVVGDFVSDVGLRGYGGEAEFGIECGATRALNDHVRVVGEGEGGAGGVGVVGVFGFVFYSGNNGHHGGRHEEGGQQREKELLVVFLGGGNVVAGIGDSGITQFWVGHGLRPRGKKEEEEGKMEYGKDRGKPITYNAGLEFLLIF